MPPQQDPKSKRDNAEVRVVDERRVQQARQEAIGSRDLDRLTAIYKALGDPTRLKAVTALMGGEMCVCDLAAFLGVSESAVSHQLRRLKDLALVKARREAQCLYYSLDDDHVAQLLDLSLTHARE